MDILEILIWTVYIIIVVVGIEVFAYFWHRFGSHTDYIPGIHEVHKLHHMANLDLGHEADEDFIWILIMLLLFEIGVALGISIDLVPGMLGLVTVVVSIAVFCWNWWIHSAYHQDGHWLNRYKWFRIEKARHYVHHYNPKMNYGISSHFTDKIMNTWVDIL